MKKNYVVMDGNTAAAYSAYAFTEVAAIYPITPSSPMAEKVDEWSAKGKKNLFGSTVDVIQMQSEAGAAGTCHGSLQAGALTTTFTSSQGLMLMIPAMYAMGGQFLPSVMHIASRVVTSNHHSIFGDHTDFMTCRMTGYAMLMSSCPQEAMDLAAVAHLSAISGRYAFMHCFDGFRTSHEMQRIEALDYEDLRGLVDQEALQAFRHQSLNPEHPTNRGNNVNPDVYFQCKEGANVKANALPDTVQHYMDEINKLTGRDYKLFNYYGAPDAEEVIVVMCSASETVKETVDYLNAQGRKVGMVQIHLFRPFSVKHFAAAIPATCKRIAVLDRNKETGSVGEPVYLDVVTALNQAGRGDIRVVGGRYGLSSKDTTPGQIVAVYDNLKQETPKNNFTIGINDDVTYTSLDYKEIELAHPGQISCKLWGLGGDGTVGANKNAISTIGLVADKYAQAYFSYDSMKSGGLTQSHLRFGDQPIRSTYLVSSADFVAVHAPTYVNKYDTTEDLKDGGTFLLNSVWDAETTKKHLPDAMKKYMAEHKINFYIINATKIASEIGLGSRTNTIMQSAFFKVSGVIPYDKAKEEMKKAIYKSYGKKGEDVVNMNYAAVERGGNVTKVKIPAKWASIEVVPTEPENAPEFIRKIVRPIESLEGDNLPVSAFVGREDGSWDPGTSQYEKRGIAVKIPEWQPDNCIQCNQCAYVCPHAAIRPFLLTEEEAEAAPEGTKTIQGAGATKAYKFKIQISPLDCTGCSNCANVCPAPNKALVMKPLEEQLQNGEEARWEYMHRKVGYKDTVVDKTVKNSQFSRPLFEFSGACAGCGETPYIKAITQLFGHRMIIANATGCSSIYGGSAPSSPYCSNDKGFGPAWANSLFEDNAEFGLGILSGVAKQRERLCILMREAIENGSTCSAELKSVMTEWIDNRKDAAKSEEIAERLIPMMEACNCPICQQILELKHYLIKKSIWIIGGDGWAYDIGFGGLDHVIASGKNVNILVLDTEVYSNTGGQSSKSTPIGAVAKFASAGKRVRKKDLGAMAMTYSYVYVAQVAMGANHNQYFQAIKEAEAYNGPSLIIAYAPCINHGIKGGMGLSQMTEKQAVESGYWHLWRYNPTLPEQGKNPFILDSKEPDWSKFQEFIHKEVRYTSLLKTFPKEAEELFAASESDAKWRYDTYKRYVAMDYSNEKKE